MDKDVSEEINDELGLQPGLGVADNQRAELLRKQHEADAREDAERKH